MSELKNLLAQYAFTSVKRESELPSELTFHGHEFLRKTLEFRRKWGASLKGGGKMEEMGKMAWEEIRKEADRISDIAILRQTAPDRFEISFPPEGKTGFPDMKAVREDHWMIDWAVRH